MSKKKLALYIGNFSFPLGNAAGKRVYANGKILHRLGYQVIYVGMSKELKYNVELKNSKNVYDGFTYYNFPYPNKNSEWLKYKKAFNELEGLIHNSNILESLDLVIYYGSPRLSLFITKLICYCKKNRIKVIADCVDWLTIKTKNPIFNIVKWADNTYQKAYINKKTNGIIAISNYLSTYYRRSLCTTVLIPPLSPTQYKKHSLGEYKNATKIICYAGLPFRKGKEIKDYKSLKDRVDKIFNLLYHIKNNNIKFKLNIYGFTKDEYLKVFPKDESIIQGLGEFVIFHGYQSNELIVDSIINSHFTILVRDVNRDTTAGFPTKVSESISCGTPVITTKTSDLSDYIVEGKSGFFINGDNEQEALYKLQHILQMKNDEVMMMKEYCLESNIFYYTNYINNLSDFLKDLTN